MSEGEAPKRHLLTTIFRLGAGVFLGLIGSSVCCLFGMGLLDRFRLPPAVLLIVAAAAIVAPLTFLLRKKPHEPFVVGLTLGLTLTGLLLGACGTLMR